MHDADPHFSGVDRHLGGLSYAYQYYRSGVIDLTLPPLPEEEYNTDTSVVMLLETQIWLIIIIRSTPTFRDIPLSVDIYFAGEKFRAKS